MQHRSFDPLVLRRAMSGAMDMLMTHLVCIEHGYDLRRMTAVREVLEERLLLALEEVDIESMPALWSWEKAAESMSREIAIHIMFEQMSDQRGKACPGHRPD